jgi:hypothetical protein
VDGSVGWPEATRVTRIGRDRTIDVVPSGDGVLPLDGVVDVLHRDAARLARRYDSVVVVAAPEQTAGGLASALPIPDVVYCVRAGQTPIAELKKRVEEIARSGSTIRGVVLWDAPDPVLYEVKPVERAEREPVPATA